MGLFHRKSAFERRYEARERAEAQREWERLKKRWDAEDEEYRLQMEEKLTLADPHPSLLAFMHRSAQTSTTEHVPET
jgi:hypothetical protein